MSAPSRRALITGITGQDGSFLAELLFERGYEVIGMVRGGRAGGLRFARGGHSPARGGPGQRYTGFARG